MNNGSWRAPAPLHHFADTGRVFSTMTSVIAPCLSALLLPPLLLLLSSSAHEQVRAVCSLAAAFARAAIVSPSSIFAAHRAIFASLGVGAVLPLAGGVPLLRDLQLRSVQRC